MTRGEMLQGMIDEYRRKVETYQAMIREWETELGIQGRSPGQSPTQGTGNVKSDTSGAEPVSLVRDYQFFNKSQPEAAKMFLEVVGHPLKTSTVVEGIEKGGVAVGGKTAKEKKTNLYTILHRSEEFGRIAKDTWGLVGWPGVKKDSKENGAEDEKKE